MTEADLDRIERALGFPLPAFYRRFMAEYPRWLLDRQPPWFDPITEWDFADDPGRVIEFNRFVRAQEPGEYFEDVPWPDEYLVIGSESDQNYYLINRISGEETVYRWSHEDGQLQTVAGSLPEFRDNLCVWFEEWKRAAEQDSAFDGSQREPPSDTVSDPKA
jgi:hypothetical protein